MCLYPKFIKNKRYLPNEKNQGMPPICTDERMRYVPIGCGNCIECREQKAREWRIRLAKEIEQHKYKYFVTLTFSNEELEKLCKELHITECNAVAAIAVRRFCERWRKVHKKSIKHWLITELGQDESERIHLHGLLFPEDELTNEKLATFWKYGISDTGQYVSMRTINYIIKYVTKIDNKHKNFKAQIFCSAGLGKAYLKEYNTQIKHKYKPHNTQEFLLLPNNTKVNLPIYYRNHIWDDDTRIKLWTDRLDKGTIYVRGIPCKVNNEEGLKKYFKLLKEQQKINEEIGFGSDKEEWKKEDYNVTLRMLNLKPPK